MKVQARYVDATHRSQLCRPASASCPSSTHLCGKETKSRRRQGRHHRNLEQSHTIGITISCVAMVVQVEQKHMTSSVSAPGPAPLSSVGCCTSTAMNAECELRTENALETWKNCSETKLGDVIDTRHCRPTHRLIQMESVRAISGTASA